MNIHITAHAIARYIERVENIPVVEVVERLNSPAVRTAQEFGAMFIKLGTGQRIVLKGATVVTVLPSTTWVGTLGREGY